jgi:hypothetical protein
MGAQVAKADIEEMQEVIVQTALDAYHQAIQEEEVSETLAKLW